MRYGYEHVCRSPDGIGAGGGTGASGGAPSEAGTGGVVSPAGASATGTGTGAGTPGQGGSWFDGLTPEDRTWAESKGWKADTSPAIIADSYKNLEKLFGADKAGRTVLLPKDATDTAAADAIFSKLGKPETADGYTITLPGGADPGFANTAKAVFHKANLTADQAKVVTDWYQALELDAAKAGQDFVKADEAALRKDWGDKFDTNRETARAAVKAAGMSDEDVEKMVGAIGPSKASKVLEFFGRNYLEASPPGQEGRAAPGFSNVTPASAQTKIDQLWMDTNFMARYNSPDPKTREGAMKEMDDLYRIAVNAKRG